MKRWLVFIFVSTVCASAVAAPKGPQVDMIDNKLSVNAEAISVGRLLHLFDLATGMTSKVPPELANRNISVRFSGLDVQDAVRKMFQGQPLDYVLIEGQGIVVTAASQAITGADSLPAFTSPAVQPIEQPYGQQPLQDFGAAPGNSFQQQQPQPPTVQTPFGPIANPRAQQPQQQQQPMIQTPFGPIANPQNVPTNTFGQQNPLFPQSQPGQPIGQQPQQPVQIVPGGQIGSPPPFGTTSPFASPNPPIQQQNNGMFGTLPVITPGTPQR
jgi:hypothetical protein